MIGSLRGRLLSKQAPQVVIECNGVGYEVETPMSTFLDLPAIGTDLSLHTHLVVREDAQILYGFATDEERSLFRTLLKVNRVGAKMALGILSTMTAGDFRRCVEYEDTTTLSKIPGVGKKTAERLIVEMRDRIGKVVTTAAGAVPLAGQASARSEAFDALVALGYKANEVNKLISKLNTEDKSAEDIIRHALKQAAG
ncbi:MAG: Holliday junction branch migration protein RuvA [Gammaproteobacteria bacterium]|nr:Holliday junction branch migration protein RuvA [Gammaproteobacteria bacterium]MDH3363714.1 Holliday junction branch migration protein RuvA [Gammaproteobacteria bacterium]MDH3481242.1 Holliday junction branch migration protein RuvA [Gammaproteobacteria bacterium]